MWSFSPKTNSEESVGCQRVKRGKCQKKETEMSTHLSVVLRPVKHLPIPRVQMPDLSGETPSLEPPDAWCRKGGPLACLSQPPLSPCPCGSPTASFPWGLTPSDRLHLQVRSFKVTQWLPPGRLPDQQEVSGVCCPLSTHCSPHSPPRVAPATQLLPGERKTPGSVYRHLQTSGETCHTPSVTLPQDSILIP